MNEQFRPRATWAQPLETVNIVDSKAPEYPLFTDKIDAEFIPETLDVPTQDVNLVELGILAFHLGSVSASTDVKHKEFNAVGPAGSITTKVFSGFGTVVRFQRHGSPELNRRSGSMHYGQMYQVFGDLCFRNRQWRYPQYQLILNLDRC